MFAVKLANFLMFTASEENTVKCLGGSLDIFLDSPNVHPQFKKNQTKKANFNCK